MRVPKPEIASGRPFKPQMRDGHRQKWVVAAVFGALLAAWLFATVAVILRIFAW
jgi:hypothetical protein